MASGLLVFPKKLIKSSIPNRTTDIRIVTRFLEKENVIQQIPNMHSTGLRDPGALAYF